MQGRLLKAFNELIIKGEQGELRVNKQQIKITTLIDSPNIGIKPGTNEIFVTDDIQNTEFYLRGEDFSEQLIEFGNSIKGATPSNNAADFESSSHVDFIINQIEVEMTELILGDNKPLCQPQIGRIGKTKSSRFGDKSQIFNSLAEEDLGISSFMFTTHEKILPNFRRYR